MIQFGQEIILLKAMVSDSTPSGQHYETETQKK